jgi:hypothetical protein
MRSAKHVLFVVAYAIVGATSAQTSREFADMARNAWAAFECASLAERMGDEREAERLFKFGVNQANAFVDANLAGRVDQSDLARYAPTMSFALSELSRLIAVDADRNLIVGFIFESAVNAAVKDISQTDGREQDQGRRRELATTKYGTSKCSIVGSSK